MRWYNEGRASIQCVTDIPMYVSVVIFIVFLLFIFMLFIYSLKQRRTSQIKGHVLGREVCARGGQPRLSSKAGIPGLHTDQQEPWGVGSSPEVGTEPWGVENLKERVYCFLVKAVDIHHLVLSPIRQPVKWFTSPYSPFVTTTKTPADVSKTMRHVSQEYKEQEYRRTENITTHHSRLS